MRYARFEAAARHGSFSEAAGELNLTAAAVGQDGLIGLHELRSSTF